MTNGSRMAIVIVALGIVVALLALKYRMFAPLEHPRPEPASNAFPSTKPG